MTACIKIRYQDRLRLKVLERPIWTRIDVLNGFPKGFQGGCKAKLRLGSRRLRRWTVPTDDPAGISLAVPSSGEGPARTAIPFPVRWNLDDQMHLILNSAH